MKNKKLRIILMVLVIVFIVSLSSTALAWNPVNEVTTAPVGTGYIASGKFWAYAYGVCQPNPTDVNYCDVAVWTETNWQDDLCWYRMTRDSLGSSFDNADYWKQIDYADHNYESGLYYIDVWATLNDGSRVFVGGTTLNVIPWSPVNEVTTAPTTTAALSSGKFWAYAYGVCQPNPTDVNYCDVAVWTETNGQDDLRWYRMTRDSLGSSYGNADYWKQIDFADHNNETGLYNVDVWATLNDGSRVYVGGVALNVI